MGSRSARISAQTVAALQPGEIIWDTDLTRFGARRRDSSTTYVVKVRIAGRQRWIALGKHGPLTSAEARAKARLTLAEIDSGRDPTREREQRRRMPTMDEFADKWFNEHVALKRKPSTAVEYRRIIDRHIKPTIGPLPLDKVGHADVEHIHSELAAQRYVANRVVAVISSIMSHAERHDLRPRNSNPCRGLERFREGKRKRPLSRIELSRLWAYFNEIESTESPYIVAALRLLLLTGMRKSEVLNLLWTDVDLEVGLIKLRDAKTGPRDVVLSGVATALLAAIPRLAGATGAV
jgi:integrase